MSAGPDEQEPAILPQRRAADQGERRQQDRKTPHDSGTPRYLDPGDTDA